MYQISVYCITPDWVGGPVCGRASVALPRPALPRGRELGPPGKSHEGEPCCVLPSMTTKSHSFQPKEAGSACEGGRAVLAEYLAHHRKPILRIDLTAVHRRRGKACLTAMHRQGAELVAADCLTRDRGEITCLVPSGDGELTTTT
jgi:hypothetical protein